MPTPAHVAARLEALKAAAAAQKDIEERERAAELAGLQLQEQPADSPPPESESGSPP